MKHSTTCNDVHRPKPHLNIVKTTITGYEGCDLFAVLDQLHTDALSDGRVRLLSLNTTAKAKRK